MKSGGQLVRQAASTATIFNNIRAADLTAVSNWPDSVNRDMALQALGDQNVLHADMLVARDNTGNPIGVASYDLIPGNSLEVHSLGTRPGTRGVGTSIMKQLASRAAQANASLTLHALEGSEGFYRRLGMSQSTIGGETYFNFTAEQTRAFANS